MKLTNKLNRYMILPILATSFILAGCTKQQNTQTSSTDTVAKTTTTTQLNDSSNSPLDTSTLFTQDDLQQTVDTTNATKITLENNTDVDIEASGTYIITGSVTESTIFINTSGDIHLVFDNVSITNTSKPAINVKNARNVYLTTTSNSTNNLSTSSEDEDIDALIYANSNLTLNGNGTFNINSASTAIYSTGDLKVTGGIYNINTDKHGLKAIKSIRIADGTFTINAGKDGLHAENEDDLTAGFIYIAGGNFTINSQDDGIQGTTLTEIDGGTFDINAVEGIEGTYVQINGGTITIYATDDGINASDQSTAYDVQLEINGGNLDITMAQGDTDALDSNGSLTINGGTINITAQFAFDYDTTATLNGGTVTVNGEPVTTITNSMMHGGPVNNQS
ncbi:MAG: carbohydrate-binding domain-containing protein, partial [Bulleidia sp.]|nr:carbohydrate-binding domain-containing protein [Bulleidia sp.]